jgi:hypothetical protein
VNGERGWKSLSSPLLNTVWPNAKANLVRASGGSASGDVNEATTVLATDGSIGYADLDTARKNKFSESFESDDNNYWIPVYTASGELEEPSLESANSSVRGANCVVTTFEGMPSGEDPTLESWREVSAANTEVGYPLCGLVSALAWDDSSDAYGSTEAEQARQRTVRDFLGYQLSETGQRATYGADQAELPSEVLEVARDGQQQIGWAKP